VDISANLLGILAKGAIRPVEKSVKRLVAYRSPAIQVRSMGAAMEASATAGTDAV
jgi:hypothetical protein